MIGHSKLMKTFAIGLRKIRKKGSILNKIKNLLKLGRLIISEHRFLKNLFIC